MKLAYFILHLLLVLNPVLFDLLKLLVLLADHKFGIVELLLKGSFLIADPTDLGFEMSLFKVEITIQIKSLNLQTLKLRVQIS